MASWINPDRSEMFFARRVILVEGETERVVLPYLAKKIGCHDTGISVIDCGSKYNLPLYIDILNAFSLNYVVVHDQDPIPDPVPETWTADKIRQKRKTFALNEELQASVNEEFGQIEILEPYFEKFSGVSLSQGQKKGKPLAALDHFHDLEIAAIPGNVVDLIRRLFG